MTTFTKLIVSQTLTYILQTLTYILQTFVKYIFRITLYITDIYQVINPLPKACITSKVKEETYRPNINVILLIFCYARY